MTKTKENVLGHEEKISMKGGKREVRLPKENEDWLVKMIKGEESVTWKYLSENHDKAVIESGNRVVYRDIEKGMDLEYVIEDNRLKENIIVKEKSEKYEYEFELETGGLIASIAENKKKIKITSKDSKKVKYMIPAPVMTDAAGNSSSAVYYTLKEKGEGKYTICVKASKAWINAEGRAFPVYIDPTVEYYGEDTYPMSFFNSFEVYDKLEFGFESLDSKQVSYMYVENEDIENPEKITRAWIELEALALPCIPYH